LKELVKQAFLTSHQLHSQEYNKKESEKVLGNLKKEKTMFTDNF
jgi:hypothetical protein